MSRLEVPEFISRQVVEHRYVFLDLRPKPGTALMVTCGGWEKCAPQYEMVRESFSFFGLEFVARGKGTVRFGKSVHELRSGSVFVYGPETAHEIRSEAREPLEKYFIDFTGRRARGMIRPLLLGMGRVFQMENPQGVREVFEQFLDHGGGNDPSRARVPRLYLEVLLALVEESAVKQQVMRTLSYASYRRCVEILAENYLTLSGVAALARAAHLDPAYVTRLFRQHGKQNPAAVLLRLKMNAAARLLKEPALSVKEVAGRAGYEDPFHFSRVFKRYWGVAPTVFSGRKGRL